MGIERDQGALDCRDLAQREGPGGVGFARTVVGNFLDGNDVAGRQHVRHLAHRLADPLLLDPGPCPPRLGQRYRAAVAVCEPDLGGILGKRKNGRQPPLVEARRRLDSDQLGLPVAVDGDPGQRSAPAVAPVIGPQAVTQRPVGNILQFRIEGRAYRQAALVEHGFSVTLGQLAAYLLGEIVRLDELGIAPGLDDQRRGNRLGRLIGGDGTVLEHSADDPVAA